MQKLKRVMPVATIALTVFFITSSSFAEMSTKKKMMTEVREASEMIKKYSVEQRDEAVQSMKSTLGKIDKRIDETESSLNRNWSRMTQSARKQKQKSIRALKKKRNEVAEWYGGLKHGSANAWDDIKKGFSDAYIGLGKALKKAERDLF